MGMLGAMVGAGEWAVGYGETLDKQKERDQQVKRDEVLWQRQQAMETLKSQNRRADTQFQHDLGAEDRAQRAKMEQEKLGIEKERLGVLKGTEETKQKTLEYNMGKDAAERARIAEQGMNILENAKENLSPKEYEELSVAVKNGATPDSLMKVLSSKKTPTEEPDTTLVKMVAEDFLSKEPEEQEKILTDAGTRDRNKYIRDTAIEMQKEQLLTPSQAVQKKILEGKASKEDIKRSEVLSPTEKKDLLDFLSETETKGLVATDKATLKARMKERARRQEEAEKKKQSTEAFRMLRGPSPGPSFEHVTPGPTRT